ncbi:MAG: dipeptide/oligopeptide/nickel ABC transporter ATP-binding protein [Elusimicrobia bacterium]|nr:MAG: dipeptide/oligopeptide/nickel ABC transporter ATP-binding protein [Elusimicrobiota bacterium]
MSAPLLEVKNLKTHFKVPGETFFSASRYVKAVDGISFSVDKGDTFGLIGESGCGKTTLGRTILALEQRTEGDALFEGRSIFSLSSKELRKMRRDVQVIFQDPFSSLDPRMTVRQILEEPFDIHRLLPNSAERAQEIHKLIDVVGLPKAHLERYPHQFSGGQRQRVGIARALALKPKLIVCDEPVSALDVSIQAQILNLLQDLQKDFDLTYLFIAHDFSVVRHLCNKVAVMYLGRIVEIAETDTLFENPQHPYTEALLSAVPVPDPSVEKKRKRILLTGDVPSPLNPPPGCHFHPRCRYAVDACKIDTPALAETAPGHRAACPELPFKNDPSAAALVEIR